jgi:hypothetical protein
VDRSRPEKTNEGHEEAQKKKQDWRVAQKPMEVDFS